jgi:4-hydroxythreonine-4-phosphate dehydrogenase
MDQKGEEKIRGRGKRSGNIEKLKLPLIGLTMGDPTGVGPEVCVKSALNPEVQSRARIIIFGDKGVINKAMKMLGYDGRVQEISKFKGFIPDDNTIYVRAISNLNTERLKPGRPDKNCGKAMVNYIREATKCALKEEIDAIVTGPINKEIINEAGFHFSGHTELMADLTGAKNYAMMMAGEKLKVVLVTTHIPLRDVAINITPGKVFRTIKLAHYAMTEYFGVKNPRIGVCGLNPHCGEGGLFGEEEKELILPAVVNARHAGILAEGPLSSDTLFYFALNGKYDVVVCMYHDQALIPLKMIHFTDAVNLTLGLPIIRASVDHGTAYDIAWRGIANPHSMIQAIKTAAEIVNIKKKSSRSAVSF